MNAPIKDWNFRLASIRPGLPPALIAQRLMPLLWALVEVDLDWLRSNPRAPALYHSGVVYQDEGPEEEWLDVPALLIQGHGDCEDLASWRVAEYLLHGQIAWPHVVWTVHGHDVLVHIQVGTPRGIEDPSRALGMP